MGALKMSGISRPQPTGSFHPFRREQKCGGSAAEAQAAGPWFALEKELNKEKKREENTFPKTWRKDAVPSQCECPFKQKRIVQLCIFAETIGGRFFTEDLFFPRYFESLANAH